MFGSKMVRSLVGWLLVALSATIMVAPVYAYEYPADAAPPQYGVHSLQSAWEASAKWGHEEVEQTPVDRAVYAGRHTVTNIQGGAGEYIRAASLNWADYAEAPVAVTVRQRWAGTLIHQASMNWADYRSEAMVVSKP